MGYRTSFGELGRMVRAVPDCRANIVYDRPEEWAEGPGCFPSPTLAQAMDLSINHDGKVHSQLDPASQYSWKVVAA